MDRGERRPNIRYAAMGWTCSHCRDEPITAIVDVAGTFELSDFVEVTVPVSSDRYDDEVGRGNKNAAGNSI